MTGINEWPENDSVLSANLYRDLNSYPVITDALCRFSELFDALQWWRDTSEAVGIQDRHLRMLVSAAPSDPQKYLQEVPGEHWAAIARSAQLDALGERPPLGAENMDSRLWLEQAVGVGPAVTQAVSEVLLQQGPNISPQQRKMVDHPQLRTPRQILEGSPPEVGKHALELSYFFAAHFYVALVNGLKASSQQPSQEHPMTFTTQPGAPAVPVVAPVPPVAAAAPTVPPVPTVAPAAQDVPSPAAPNTPAPTTRSSDTQSVDPGGFAGYIYAERGEAQKANLTRTVEQEVKIMWPKHEGHCVYRVVSADGPYPPASPDEGTLHTATLGTIADDLLPRTQSIRHYQIWRHDGPDVEQAKLAQPVLHAELSSASPVEGVEFREEDGGQVIAQWTCQPGTVRVHVYRVPAELPMRGVGDPAFRIVAEQDALGGFVDNTTEPGKRYRYEIASEVEIGGVPVLSDPIVQTWETRTRLERITDLSFTLYDAPGSSPCFDLSWTAAEAGTTSIYRTAQPPNAGLGRTDLPEAALEGAGLRQADRLVHPVSMNGATATMSTVNWPMDWTRAYFTPVVSHAGKVLVGETVSGVRVPPVEQPMLQDRLHRQLVTFEWPKGAASVQVYQVAAGADFGAAYGAGPMRVLESEEVYRAGGGLVFERGQLATDLNGCDLYLIGVAYEDAQPYVSAPSSVHYSPVVPLAYRLQFTRSILGASNGVSVELMSREYDVPMQLNFALVVNPDRMPLNPFDGTPIAMQQNVEQPGAPVTMFPAGPFPAGGSPAVSWKSEPSSFKQATQGGGYIRLFLYNQPHGPRVALIDPPASQLVLGRKLPWQN